MPKREPIIPAHLQTRRRYASLADAAAYLDCSEKTLRRIATGKLTGYRSGRILRVDLNEIDDAFQPMPTVNKAG